MEVRMAAKTFKDLLVWQESYQLSIEIYNATKVFPKEEVFGITSQLRRAIVSVCSNIAEGFGRSSRKEKDQFYSMANGSLTEVENQLLISKGIGYLDDESFKKLDARCQLTHKLLNGLQRVNKEKGAEAILKSRI
jgi:four helix bundle protein